MKEPTEAVMLRLPIAMKRTLEQIARINRRSLNAEVQTMLEAMLPDPLEPTDTRASRELVNQ